MRQYMSYEGETLYIASPACFYQEGYTLWHALRGKAEYYGFRVMMPTTVSLNLNHEDPRLNADEIFHNCARAMNQCTALIADLEFFRGMEPDGGTLFEVGMAAARGMKIYAYTRDKRPMIHKASPKVCRGTQALDDRGWPLPYGGLPFCPCLMGAAKVFEGGFEDALQLVMIDVEREKREQARPQLRKPEQEPENAPTDGKTAFLFSPRVYAGDGAEWYERQRCALRAAGLNMLSPLEPLPGEPVCGEGDEYLRAMVFYERWRRQVRACDLLLVDLNDFHGLEPSGDAAFLAGYAWQLQKKCLGFMADTRAMRERIPHGGPEVDHRDACGSVVENFNYPINLMFASSMPILEGEPETWADKAAEQLAR